jgi:hypothetical protein
MYIYIFRLWLRHDLMFLPATAAKIYQPFTKQSSPNAFFGGRNLTSSITWIFLNHLKSKFCMVESLFYLEISPTTLGTKKQKNSWLDCSCIGIQTSTSVTWTVKELQAGAPAPVGGVINLINWYNYNKPRVRLAGIWNDTELYGSVIQIRHRRPQVVLQGWSPQR